MDPHTQEKSNTDTTPYTGEQSLSQRVLRSSALQFGGRFAFRGLKFIRTIVVAQLLFPEDVGLFVLASLCLGFADVFAQTGFQSAIVERDSLERKHLDGAWTVHVVKGLVLGATAFLLAPALAQFFNEPMLTDVLRVLSVILALDGFVNVGVILLQRDLQFGKKVLFDFSYIVTEILAVIIAVQFIPNVWALVIGTVASQIASTAFSYVFHEYRPRLILDMSGARELFRYGKWVSMMGLITFFVSKGDGIAISKLIGVEELAYYQLALSLALLPGLEIVRALGSVFFPYFSRLKTCPDELRTSFIRITRMVLAVVVPAIVGLYVAAYPIISTLYGERWLPIIPVLHILIFYGAFKTIEYFITPILLGTGNPKSLTYGTVLYAAVLAVVIIPLTLRMGVLGTAWSLVLASGISTMYLSLCFYRVMQIHMREVLAFSFVPIGASVVMYFAVLLQEQYVLDSAPVSILVGGIVYTTTALVMDTYSGKNLRNSIAWIRQNLLVKRATQS